MNHATGAGLIARPVDQRSSSLALYHGCSLMTKMFFKILWFCFQFLYFTFCVHVFYAEFIYDYCKCSFSACFLVKYFKVWCIFLMTNMFFTIYQYFLMLIFHLVIHIFISFFQIFYSIYPIVINTNCSGMSKSYHKKQYFDISKIGINKKLLFFNKALKHVSNIKTQARQILSIQVFFAEYKKFI